MINWDLCCITCSYIFNYFYQWNILELKYCWNVNKSIPTKYNSWMRFKYQFINHVNNLSLNTSSYDLRLNNIIHLSIAFVNKNNIIYYINDKIITHY